MERILKRNLFKISSILQQETIKIFSQVKSFAPLINMEDETDESSKTFYLLSLMLLISLIFLSPDKVPQAFTPTQGEIGILEKVQEVMKVIKKLTSNLV